MARKNSEHEIVKTMGIYGGGFIKQLAILYRFADSDNQRKLQVAFEDYFDKYDEMTTARLSDRV